MSWDKDLKIKQIDNIISQLRLNKNFHRQKDGWLKLIRTTLGMSARALGERVKVTQSRIALIEKGEILESARKKQTYKKANMQKGT